VSSVPAEDVPRGVRRRNGRRFFQAEVSRQKNDLTLLISLNRIFYINKKAEEETDD